MSASELARLVGVKRGTCAMFLAWWLTTGLVEEPLPGRFRLTAKGQRVADGLLEDDEVTT